MTGDQKNRKPYDVDEIVSVVSAGLMAVDGELFNSLSAAHQRYLVNFFTNGKLGDDTAKQLLVAFSRRGRQLQESISQDDAEATRFNRWRYIRSHVTKNLRIRDLSLFLTFPFPYQASAGYVIRQSLETLLIVATTRRTLEVSCYPWNNFDDGGFFETPPFFNVGDEFGYYCQLADEVRVYSSIHVDGLLQEDEVLVKDGRFFSGDLVEVWRSYLVDTAAINQNADLVSGRAVTKPKNKKVVEKNPLWERAVRQAYIRNPALSHKAICDRLALELRENSESIRRKTTNPKPKK